MQTWTITAQLTTPHGETLHTTITIKTDNTEPDPEDARAALRRAFQHIDQQLEHYRPGTHRADNTQTVMLNRIH